MFDELTKSDIAKKIELAYSEAVTAKHNAKYSQKQNYDFFFSLGNN